MKAYGFTGPGFSKLGSFSLDSCRLRCLFATSSAGRGDYLWAGELTALANAGSCPCCSTEAHAGSLKRTRELY